MRRFFCLVTSILLLAACGAAPDPASSHDEPIVETSASPVGPREEATEPLVSHEPCSYSSELAGCPPEYFCAEPGGPVAPWCHCLRCAYSQGSPGTSF